MKKRRNNETTQDARNRALCNLIKENNLLAENKLLMENETFIRSISNKLISAGRKEGYLPVGAEKDDLLQEGRLAMLKAAESFDPSLNTKFTTYAYPIIHNAMVDVYREGMSTFECYMENKGLARIFLDAPGFDLDNAVQGDTSTTSNIAYHDPTGNLAVLHVMIEKMRNRFELLPERQRRLLAYIYGLSPKTEHTIAETAALYHIAEKTVKREEKSALATLREGMNDGKII